MCAVDFNSHALGARTKSHRRSMPNNSMRIVFNGGAVKRLFGPSCFVLAQETACRHHRDDLENQSVADRVKFD